MLILKCVFWFVAAIAIGFYGWFGTTIVGMGGKKMTFGSDSTKHWSWWVHEIWINALGSLVGWAALYHLVFVRLIFCRTSDVTLSDGFFVVIALVGICGFLPWRLYNTGIR
jgi:hypothetical protein